MAGMSHAQCRSLLRGWQQMHMRGGANDLGYGSVICQHGVWMEGRTQFRDGYWLTRVGSNGTFVANSNNTSVQMMLGTADRITGEQTAWFAEAVATLRANGWGRAVRPHSDFYSTACPGDSIRGAIPQIKRLADGWSEQEEGGLIKRIDYAHRKKDRVIKTGKWVTITREMKSGPKGSQTMMLSQGLIRPEPKILGARIRFVRIKGTSKSAYEKLTEPRRDGTGDLYLTASPAGNLHWSHNHTIQSGNFVWVAQIKVESKKPTATLAYSIAKSFI